MVTELFIEGRKADLAQDLSALLTFSVDDIATFGSRNTSFSKTIVLPGTANNNNLFGQVFDVNTGNFHNYAAANVGYNFNAARSAEAVIFQGNIQVFKGVLRLLEIIIDNGIEYEVSVFGELGGFVNTLANRRLDELDFSAYNQTFTRANIVASWDNQGSGLFYPLIDYGGYSVNKHDWDIRTFRPALFVKEYLDKIITGAGYQYSAPLFDTPRFKSLVIPNNAKGLYKPVFNLLDARRTTNQVIIDEGVNKFGRVIFSSVTATDFVPSQSNTLFTFIGTLPVQANFKVVLKGEYFNQSPTADRILVTIRKNTGAVAVGLLDVTPGQQLVPFDITVSGLGTLNPNDVIDINFNYPGDINDPFEVQLESAVFTIGSTLGSFLPVEPGDSIDINYTIPKGYLQKDFFVWILKLFNLYVHENKDKGKFLEITPYPDFMDVNPANALDWSLKMDRSSPVRLKPLNEINARFYEFKFKADSDYYNETYRKLYNEGYGDRVFDSEIDFFNDKQAVEVGFSATPLVGYTGKDKIYPTILKLNGVVEERVESNIRIMLTKKVSVIDWQMKNGANVISTETHYGYAGHLDDPDAPGNDLNWGAPKELFFDLAIGNISANQFNVYWSSYMAEITDKDSKLLTAKFRLNELDIANLDFSKMIYVDGSLFRLNKLVDYNASNPDLTTVELLKIINTEY